VKRVIFQDFRFTHPSLSNSSTLNFLNSLKIDRVVFNPYQVSSFRGKKTDSVNYVPITCQTEPANLRFISLNATIYWLSAVLSTNCRTDPVKIPTIYLSTNCRTDPVNIDCRTGRVNFLQMATRQPPALEGWEVTGSHDGHQMMRCKACNAAGKDARKKFDFRSIPSSIRRNLTNLNDAFYWQRYLLLGFVTSQNPCYALKSPVYLAISMFR
jgi:hypothetical protein